MSDNPKELLANIAPFGLRMQAELKDQLKAAAEQNGRSMNGEIVARLESYPKLARLPMDVSYLKMENERLAGELLEAKTDAENQRVLVAQLQHLLSEDLRKAERDQETLGEIERQFNKLKEQSDYLKTLKAELLEATKERDEAAEAQMRVQAALIDRLTKSQETNAVILRGFRKVFLKAADGNDDELKKLVEVFQTIGEEDS
ncbi:hypothetical protein FHX10_004562 [Rhizobium sp. BK591]|uniref:Arc family DNA-binding protein n=1 Tax=Rhizobium sp. BK591 TaxID=2586985 RepID=UPI00162299EE|nr:Arc family DNA-binding protein [Rhizobium sp. BK591]MBB3745025.1 hypothetical protein [Rhizobium sp. BK591]